VVTAFVHWEFETLKSEVLYWSGLAKLDT
jgi:hypothetical protein